MTVLKGDTLFSSDLFSSRGNQRLQPTYDVEKTGTWSTIATDHLPPALHQALKECGFEDEDSVPVFKLSPGAYQMAGKVLLPSEEWDVECVRLEGTYNLRGEVQTSIHGGPTAGVYSFCDPSQDAFAIFKELSAYATPVVYWFSASVETNGASIAELGNEALPSRF
jgi:hypothetical protein